MQSTNLSQIKRAIWHQAFKQTVTVSCVMGQVVAVRRRKGQLLALIKGWGRWYPVPWVRIDGAGCPFA